jgi:tight adherence protein B
MSPEILAPFLAVMAAAAMAVFAVWYFVSAALTARRERLERRLAGDPADEPLELVTPPQKPGWAGRFDAGFADLLSRTGLDLDAPLALGVILFCGVGLAAAVFVWRFDQEPWLALPAFFVGVAVPLAFFVWRQNAWRRTLQDQLPDALFLLARSLRAGRSVEQGFQLIGEQGVPPLSREFARMSRQTELGLSLAQVTQSAARRLGLVDFNVFASLLSLHRSTGGNLPLLLDRLATSTRDRNQFDRQYRTATVMGRWSAAFISCLALVILFYFFFFQRDWALRYFETSTGLALLGTALGLEVAGLVLLYWLLRYEY